jgi:hypothetical protein
MVVGGCDANNSYWAQRPAIQFEIEQKGRGWKNLSPRPFMIGGECEPCLGFGAQMTVPKDRVVI